MKSDYSCEELDLQETRGKHEVASTSKYIAPRISIPPQNSRSIPKSGTGGFAILVAMIEKEEQNWYRGFMTKTEIQQRAEKYCNVPMDTYNIPTNHYSGWNCMYTLVKNKFIIEKGQDPSEYSLTETGRGVAEHVFGTQWPANEQSTNSDGNVFFQPEEFEIVLFADLNEAVGIGKPELKLELETLGIAAHIQPINVGDFIWVCRKKPRVTPKGRIIQNNANTLVLPYVVERKRLDDLLSSIKDGRYAEQKQRLNATKMNVIYLLESSGTRGKSPHSESLIRKVINDMQDMDNYFIIETTSFQDTLNYLAKKTEELKAKYESKTLVGFWKAEKDDLKNAGTDKEAHLMFFSDYKDYSCKKHPKKNEKTLDGRDGFLHFLMLKDEVTEEIASAIVIKYHTIGHLGEAYDRCESVEEKNNLLADIDVVSTGSKIGASLSKLIKSHYYYMLY